MKQITKEALEPFNEFIDKLKADLPEMEDPTVLILSHEGKGQGSARAFAYMTDNQFSELIGNLLINNPSLIEPAKYAINGALNFIKEQEGGKDDGNAKTRDINS